MSVNNFEKQPLQPEDLANLQFLGEVQLSPDARQVYYDVYYINREKNTYQGEIWQLDISQNQCRKLTGGPRRDNSPRLSNDGTKLAFLSDRGEDNKKQVYLLEPGQPGEALRLTNFQSGVLSVTWSSDNRHLAVVVETPDASEKAANWSRPETSEARKEREAREQEEKRVGGNPVTFTRVKQRADGRRTLVPNDAHNQLWLLDTAAPEAAPRQLTTGPFGVGQPAFSPDGQRLIFSSTRDQQQADFSCISDLWLVEPFGDDLTPRKLTSSKGPANGPVWSPDGKAVAFVGHTNPKDGSFLEQSRVWVLEMNVQGADGEARCLTANFDRPVANLLNTDLRVFGETPLAWTEDSRDLFFAACSEGSMQLFRVSVDGPNEPQAITNPDRHIYAYSFAAKTGQVAFASSMPLDPGDIFLQSIEVRKGKGEAPQQLTFLNREWVESHYIVEPETIRVPVEGGIEVEGWLIKPPGFDPSKKYPLVLQVHGGPHTAYGHSFNYEFQMLAGQGQVVLYTNPRGSVGYGYDFAAAIHNDWGHHDYDDIMAALDYVIEQGYIDTDRLGVTGGSYGGYMTNWIVTHTDRFKAALTQRCVSNLMTMYTLSDISFGFVESEFEGDMWSNPRIWERSPMAHANKAKTPLLMLHSEADYRCPIEQAEEFFFALKRSGCEVELVRTPAEDHNLSRNGSPDHRIGRLGRIGNWFKKRLE